MQEIWEDIEGYEGLYQISNYGKVKSLKRKYKNRINKENVLLSYKKLPKGYLKVALSKNGVIKYYFVHRLVAQKFIPNPNDLPCVNHKDCNPQNNKADNLEWVTYKDNNNYKNHHLKKYISHAIYLLKKNYEYRTDLIKMLEEVKAEINKL